MRRVSRVNRTGRTPLGRTRSAKDCALEVEQALFSNARDELQQASIPKPRLKWIDKKLLDASLDLSWNAGLFTCSNESSVLIALASGSLIRP